MKRLVNPNNPVVRCRSGDQTPLKLLSAEKLGAMSVLGTGPLAKAV
jgi:hypothetical protein